MVHVRVSEAYIHFALIYATDHIFLVLPFKDLINEDIEPTTPFKISTGTKPSVSYSRMLFCPCAVQKSTAHVGKKVLNMCHQAQKGFCSIFAGIPQHQKGYLVYVPHTRKIISSYDVVFDDIFLVRWHICHKHMQKRWICDWLCHTHLMLHLQGKNWRYNHVPTVWRGGFIIWNLEFIIWNLWRYGKQ